MDDEITPASVMTAFWRWFGVGVLALALVAALVVASWRAHWWFANQNTTRQAHLVQNNYNTQEGYISAISSDVAQLDGVIAQEPGAPDPASLRAQAIAIGNQACLEAGYLTGSVPVPASMKGWIGGNCSAGAVSPASPLMKGTGN